MIYLDSSVALAYVLAEVRVGAYRVHPRLGSCVRANVTRRHH